MVVVVTRSNRKHTPDSKLNRDSDGTRRVHTDTVSYADVSLRGRIACWLRLHDYLLLDGGDAYLAVLGQHVVEQEPMVGCRRCGYRQEGMPRFWIGSDGPHLRLGRRTVLGSYLTQYVVTMAFAVVILLLLQLGPVLLEAFMAIYDLVPTPL